MPFFLCACGLTVRGSAEPDDAGGIDASLADVSVNDAGMEETAPEPPCLVEFDEPFATATFDPTKWFTTRNAANAGYPKPHAIDRQLVLMLEPTTTNARGGLWYAHDVPFTAFDIDLDLQIACDNAASCGDGLAIVFLDPADETKLEAATAGASLGIPAALNGGAVAVDLAKNAELADGEAPSIGILDIDATKTPGAYAWTLTFSPADPTLKTKAHRLAMSMRHKQVSVKLDGAVVISGAMPHLPTAGTFGFTAASGGWTARIFFGDLHAKFYRCNAP